MLDQAKLEQLNRLLLKSSDIEGFKSSLAESEEQFEFADFFDFAALLSQHRVLEWRGHKALLRSLNYNLRGLTYSQTTD